MRKVLKSTFRINLTENPHDEGIAESWTLPKTWPLKNGGFILFPVKSRHFSKPFDKYDSMQLGEC